MKKNRKGKPLASSPVPKKSNTAIVEEEKKTTDFLGAVKALMDGEKVRCESWPQGIHAEVSGGFLMLKKEDGYHQWLISDGDMTATDWETL